MKPASFDVAEWIDAWRDRRPMTDDAVLVTAWNPREERLMVSTARYYCEEEYKTWNDYSVVAWMPLPEAYDPVEAAEQLPSGIFIDGESVRFIK